MSDAPAETPKPAAPPAPSKPIVMLALLGLNLAATGFVAFKLVTAKPGTASAASHGDGNGEHKSGDKVGKSETGPVVSLDPFLVNLNEPGSARYLKASFDVELVSAKATPDMVAQKRVIRDEVLRYLSSLSVADTMGEEAKSKIQKEVLARIEQAVGEGRVKRLFFNDFMVQ